jgi:CRP/FNR family cyclic AMP-dependent transcriptional regulator
MNNLSAEGKSVTFTRLSADGWFGEGTILKNELRKYDVTALRDNRVARCLAAMLNARLYPGADMLLQISQEEIGYLSGASRQRANQALQVLEKEGLLKVDYGGIQILDLDGLRRFRA